MGYKISLVNGFPEMSYDTETTIATDLLLSALIKQGSFFLDSTLGLRPLPKKNTDQNINNIKDYFKESAQWLLDVGRAKSIEITAERDESERNRINVREVAVQKNDTPAEFETFVGVI